MGPFAHRTPLLPDETITSWVSRVARNEARLGPIEFLQLIGLKQENVIAANPHALNRLAALAGTAEDALARGACVPLGDRGHLCCGEAFQVDFCSRARIRYCPACLLADGKPDGPSRGRRVGRVSWLFAPVRTRPAHLIPLVESRTATLAHRLMDMTVVAPNDAALRALVSAATPRPVSPLQSYVLRRLEGGAGPAWLDTQRIDLVARATEMLGAVLIHGTEQRHLRLTEAQWDTAGAEGWRFTSRGPQGVHEALSELVARFRMRCTKGGPQAAFGALFKWLQVGPSSESRGPMADVAREFVLDSMAIAPGTNLFGQIVETRRRHSVASLASEFKLHRKTLNRALVTTGLIPDGDPDRVDDKLSVDAAAGEHLAARVRGAVPSTALPKRLGCGRSEARGILSAGMLLRIGEARPGSKVVLNMVAAEDVDAFVARLFARSAEVDLPSAGMTSLIAAAKRAKCGAADILQFILDGKLVRAERTSGDVGLRALRVDPDDVRRIMSDMHRPPGLTLAEAGKALDLSSTAVRRLTETPDRDGRPFLATQYVSGLRRLRITYTTLEAVERFRAAHVDLGSLACERGIPKRALLASLNAAFVKPILPREHLDKYVFRRADL